MKFNFGASPTSVILRVKLMDSSATDGSGLTGLTFSSAGLIISTIKIGDATATAYTQAGSTIETVTTLGTYSAPTASKCRFKEVDSTNHPGMYEIQIADARFASTTQLQVSISGATDLAECDFEVSMNVADVNMTKIGGVTQSATDLKDFADTGYNPSTHKVAGVLLTDTCTTNSDMRGTDGAAVAGDLMGLADDAITSAKFDESSAYPLKSADTGSTQIARTGADSDTLETVSDQIDTITAKLPSKDYIRGTADADGGMDTADKADINAQCKDIIDTDTSSDPSSGVRPAATTLRKKIDYIFAQISRKLISTNALETLYDSDGNAINKRVVGDDDTTTTKYEWTAP